MDVEPDMARAMKTFRKLPRYGTAVGRIMMHEATLLNWQRVERLIESSFNDCLTVLLDTEYGPYLEKATRAREVEEGLLAFLAAQYALLDSICEGTFVAGFMHLKYDFHNVKVVLKGRNGDVPIEGMLSGLGELDTARLAASVEQGGAGNLPGYWNGLLETLCKVVDRGDGPQVVDTLADREFLERRLMIARGEKSRLLVDFSRAAIDVANLKVLLRGRGLDKGPDFYREALASGGRLDSGELVDLAAESFDRLSGRLLATRYGRMLEHVLGSEEKVVRLTSLDRDSDDYLLEKLGFMSRMALGPERIIKYMLTREDEVTLLRITLMGKLHGISSEVLERRIRPSLVRGGVQ